MHFSKNNLKKSAFYSDFIIDESIQTDKLGKFIALYGFPSIIYFIFQDIYLVKIPDLLPSRVIFLIPFITYMLYVFLCKKKNPLLTELLHSVFLLSLLLMTISMILIMINLEQGFQGYSRQVLNAYIVNNFVIYLFAGVSLRWLHLILGFPLIIMMIAVRLNQYTAMEDNLVIFSNSIFIVTILSISSFGMSKLKFDKFVNKRKLEEEIEKNIKINEKLIKTLEENKVLNGMLPICAHCKKIKDENGYWNQIESYIENHTEAQFSHGLCENCTDTLYGNEDWYKNRKNKK